MRATLIASAIAVVLATGSIDAAAQDATTTTATTTTKHHHHKVARRTVTTTTVAGPNMQAELAQRDREIAELKSALADVQAKVGELEQRTDAQSDVNVQTAKTVETLQDSAKKTDKLEKIVNDTSVGGRVFVDISDIEQKKNGVKTAATGTGLDVKRGYLTFSHSFNDIWSVNVITDFNYATLDGETQVFFKNVYLQGKFSDAFAFRIGEIPMPWTPYVENFYGYRYVENTLTDRAKFANTADWGVSASGKFGDGMFDYSAAVVNGNGYKNPSRSKGMDFEGRLAFSPVDGLGIAIGGYSGDRGQETQLVNATHTGNRGDAMVAWAKGNNRLGAEYFTATDWNSIVAPTRDKANGWSLWGSLGFAKDWAVFGRYDHVNLTPNEAVDLTNHDKYYNLGVQWDVRKGVKLAVVYKNDNLEDNVAKATTKTEEFGVFGDIAV